MVTVEFVVRVGTTIHPFDGLSAIADGVIVAFIR